MFKPKNANGSSPKREWDSTRKYPEPKAGSRPARVALIVDLGIQERPDFEDPKTKEKKPQAPCQQVAVYADLPNDVVDYGGEIGMKPYRVCLNKTFGGEMIGVNFVATPPKDGNGNLISGKPWTLHPQSLLTKLAKATKQLDVIETMDVEQLLDKPFMAQIEVKKSESSTKKDDNGNPVIFTNINYKGCAEVPLVEDENGNEKPINVKPLTVEPLCITFDNAKPEHIQFLRKNVIDMIKLAKNYAGTPMQKAIEQYEKDRAEKWAAEEAAKTAAPTKSNAKASKTVEPDLSEDASDEEPF